MRSVFKARRIYLLDDFILSISFPPLWNSYSTFSIPHWYPDSLSSLTALSMCLDFFDPSSRSGNILTSLATRQSSFIDWRWKSYESCSLYKNKKCEDKDMSEIVRLDLQFHRLLLRECGHAGLESVWLPLLGGLRLPYSRHKLLTESYQEHKQIADAIEQGDTAAATESLRSNIMQPFVSK